LKYLGFEPERQVRQGTLLKRLAVVLLVVLMLSSSVPVFSAPAVQSPVQASALSLAVVPSKLPADGGQYAALYVSLMDNKSLPSIALADTVVELSSATTSIATVPPTVTIKAGKSYEIVTITTTVSAGAATITASSSGYKSASATVDTLVPTGYPSHIKLFASPANFVARPSNQQQQGTLIAGLFDDTGLPAKAVSDTTIQISSSSPNIASVGESSITIPAGQFFASGTFAAGFIPGTATIIGSRTGYFTGSVSVKVTGPAPFKLNLFALPNRIITSSTGRLILSLSDASGNPARANQTIVASLVSSDPDAITPPSTITIPAGLSWGPGTYISGTKPCNSNCSAIVTAVFQGLASSSVTITSYASSGTPYALKVFLGPTTVLADNNQYPSIVFSVVNAQNLPVAVPSAVSPVLVSSSNTGVGTVLTARGTIQTGNNWGSAEFQSTFASGSTTIVAAANGLKPDQQQLNSFGPVPTQLVLRGVPTVIPADGGAYTSLEVSLADPSGQAAIAAQDVPVQLFSTTPDVISVAPSDQIAVIPKGSTSVLVTLQTALIAGKSNITASSAGLQSALLTAGAIIPAPSQLQVFVSPAKSVLTAGGGDPVVAVQLQDNLGNPARARQDTTVTISSSSSSVESQTITLTIPAGEDYAQQTLQIGKAGSATLTATSSGLKASTFAFAVVAFPLTATLTITASRGYIYTNETAPLAAQFTFLGKPLRNLNLTWTATLGTVSPTASRTGTTGRATSVFTPSGAGGANVTIATTSPGAGPIHLSKIITVFQVPQKKFSIIGLIFEYWYILAAVVAAAVIASVYLLRLRRQKRRVELEAEFETA
jgi:hypothetical protein